MSENINISFSIEDVDYDVTITEIGELVDEPDGGGTIPIDYSVVPEPATDKDWENLNNAINSFMINAIETAIKEETKNENSE